VLVVILVSLALVALGLIAAFGVGVRTWIEVGLLAVALLPVVVEQIPALYLRIRRARFWLLNTAATWDLSVRFSSRTPQDASELAAHAIQWGGANSSLISSTGGRSVARIMSRFVVEFHTPALSVDSASPSNSEVNVAVSPVTVGYRDARRFLDNELLPLLDKLRELVSAERVSYSLRVQLPEQNPYFGLFLKQLRSDVVADFRVNLEFPSRAGSSTVLVGKDRLTVTAPSLEAFRTASVAALAFKVPEGRHA
jgi:hypothetical protein